MVVGDGIVVEDLQRMFEMREHEALKRKDFVIPKFGHHPGKRSYNEDAADDD